MSFIRELKRRNVFRAAAAYIFASWLIIQVIETIFPAFGFGDAIVRLAVTILAIGFIPVVVLAWAFELTPDGLKPDSEVDHTSPGFKSFGKKLDRVVMVVLVLALGFFAFDKFVLAPQQQTEQLQAAREQGREEALDESFGDKSIAVLPFLDLSAEGDQEYFSDGISEELLNVLTGIPELRVISRSSAFSFKGTNTSIMEIARILNVDHILEGSVRKQGSQVRITAQLIDTRNDSHLWSQNYDRALDNIFAVQDDIAARVAEQLKLTLLGEQLKSRETNPEAYNLYLQAIYIMHKVDFASSEQAAELFEQVLKIDPEYAPAWNGLSRIYSWWAQSSDIDEFDKNLELAWDAVDRALAIDPDYAPSRIRQAAFTLVYDNDLSGSASLLNDVLASHPGNPEALELSSTMLRALGRQHESVEVMEFMVAREMTSARLKRKLGKTYLDARRFEDAETAFMTALTLSPGGRTLNYNLGRALLLQDRSDEALAAMQAEPVEFYRLLGLALAYHDLGLNDESDAAISKLMEKFPSSDYDYMFAFMFAYCEQTDRAFELLEKMATPSEAPILLNTEALFSKLYDDPRWMPYLERIGQAPQQLNAIELQVSLP